MFFSLGTPRPNGTKDSAAAALVQACRNEREQACLGHPMGARCVCCVLLVVTLGLVALATTFTAVFLRNHDCTDFGVVRPMQQSSCNSSGEYAGVTVRAKNGSDSVNGLRTYVFDQQPQRVYTRQHYTAAFDGTSSTSTLAGVPAMLAAVYTYDIDAYVPAVVELVDGSKTFYTCEHTGPATRVRFYVEEQGTGAHLEVRALDDDEVLVGALQLDVLWPRWNVAAPQPRPVAVCTKYPCTWDFDRTNWTDKDELFFVTVNEGTLTLGVESYNRE